VNTTSGVYSKNGRASRSLMLSDAIGSEIESFDIGTNALYKVALFSNVSSGSSEISNIFLMILKKSLAENSKLSLYRLFSFLSFHYFKKKFIITALTLVKKMRSDWLLLQCEVTELSGLDSKSAQFYFSNLEKRIFEEYVSGWLNAQNCLKNEFIKLRKKFLFSLLKKYFNFLLFWCFIFLAIYIALHITSKENSLTMWDQFKGWINFLLQMLH
jgi:hypothetical protein